MALNTRGGICAGANGPMLAHGRPKSGVCCSSNVRKHLLWPFLTWVKTRFLPATVCNQPGFAGVSVGTIRCAWILGTGKKLGSCVVSDTILEWHPLCQKPSLWHMNYAHRAQSLGTLPIYIKCAPKSPYGPGLSCAYHVLCGMVVFDRASPGSAGVLNTMFSQKSQ